MRLKNKLSLVSGIRGSLDRPCHTPGTTHGHNINAKPFQIYRDYAFWKFWKGCPNCNFLSLICARSHSNNCHPFKLQQKQVWTTQQWKGYRENYSTCVPYLYFRPFCFSLTKYTGINAFCHSRNGTDVSKLSIIKLNERDFLYWTVILNLNIDFSCRNKRPVCNFFYCNRKSHIWSKAMCCVILLSTIPQMVCDDKH